MDPNIHSTWIQVSIQHGLYDYSWATDGVQEKTDQHFLQDTHRFFVGHGVGMHIAKVFNQGEPERASTFMEDGSRAVALEDQVYFL